MADPGYLQEEHVVDGYAQGPDVGLEGVLLLPKNLGAHELDGSGEGGGLLVAVVVVDDLGHSKIGYFYAILVDKDIFGFYIPVDDIFLFQKF